MSWRAAASLTGLLAVAAALAVTATPAEAGLECEQQTPRELAGQAEVVFAGRVVALVQDHDTVKTPPKQLQPVLRFWPKFVPVPQVTSQVPGQGTPAARFQVTTAYKGRVATTMTVRTLGNERRFSTGDTWTVFADRSHGYLFTTECSGNIRGAIRPTDYGLTASPPQALIAGEGPPAELFWALGAAGLLAALGAAALAVWLALPAQRARRGRGEPG